MKRMILWPGLAADERMYQRLGECGWQIETPRLPVPSGGESMADYARRCSEQAGVSEGDVVGGCSFGSMLATQVARKRKVRGLVLLAGALDSSTLAAGVRWLGRLPAVLPIAWMRGYFASDKNLQRFFGEQDEEGYALARQMLDDTSDAMLQRGGRLAVKQPRLGLPDVPTFALHGSEDRVMRPPACPACELVKGAGHGLVFSHHHEVTRFLRDLHPKLG